MGQADPLLQLQLAEKERLQARWCCLVMPGDAWCNLQELFQRLTSDPSSVGEDVARIPAQQILAGPKLVVAALFPRRSLQSCRTA